MARKKQAPEQAPAKKVYAPGDETFEQDGKKYAIQVPAVIIPGFGRRTAAELALDKETQKALLAIEGQGIAQELL